MLRTTLIRGSLLGLLALILGALWWAQHYVQPEAVRNAVLDSFAEQFPGSHVTVGDAHMRLFNGVSVRNLSLARDDESLPFFDARTAVIAHDKEALSAGRMVIRKIELDGATLRLERRADGRWTFDGLSKPAPADRPVPMFVVTHGTITITDKSPSGLPALTFTDANFTLINDPPPLFLNVKGTALMSVASSPLSPVRVELTGRLHRLTGEFNFRAVANDVTVGPEFAELVRRWNPALAANLASFTATATLKADLSYKPDAPQPLTYDLDVEERTTPYTDPRLPVPVEAIEATARFHEGKLTVEKATAKLGTSTAEVRMETRALPSTQPTPIPSSGPVPAVLASTIREKSRPAQNDALAELEQHVEKLDLTLRELTLSDELFGRLGERAEMLHQKFRPVGVVAFSYRFSRQANNWRRDFELRPSRFGMTYEKFCYPLTELIGLVRKSVTSQGLDETLIDLTGTAGGQRVDIKGTITGGDSPDPGIDVRVSGNNIPIDDHLFESLPRKKHQESLKKLRATGRMDFVAEVKQEAGVNLSDSVFRIKVYDTSFSHTHCPYPLEKVAGQISIALASSEPDRPLRPGQPLSPLPDTDRVTLSDFTGKHGKGSVTFHGTHAVIPGETDRRLTLNVTGRSCPVDADMKAMLAALKLNSVNTTFSPRGEITFAVDVEIADRNAVPPVKLPPPFDPATPPSLRGTLTSRPNPNEATPVPFNPATDLTMTMQFTGPSVTPDFFPYDLDDFAGRVRYDGTQVRIEKITAKHGTSQWALDAGEVRFFKDGRIWANIGQLDVTPVMADEAFLKALPKSLEKAVREINLRGPSDLTLRHLVVLTPPDAPHSLRVLSPLPWGRGVRGEGR